MNPPGCGYVETGKEIRSHRPSQTQRIKSRGRVDVPLQDSVERDQYEPLSRSQGGL